MKDIDKQIAEKVMGWTLNIDVHRINLNASTVWFNEDNRLMIDVLSWKPSTSIAHAWQVVEKMTNDALWFRITAVHGRGYEVTIFKAGLGKITKHSLKDELITEFENTAPLAICKAALKVIES